MVLPSIRKRSPGTYEYRWEGPRGEDGKRVQVQKTFRGNKKETYAKWATYVAELYKSEAQRAAEMPVREFCRLFLEKRTGIDIRFSTASVYESVFRLYLVPDCGDMPMAQVGQDAVQKVVDRMLDRPLSARTVRSKFGYVRRLFTWAVEKKYLSESPAKSLTLPEVPHKRSGRTLSAEQARELLRDLEDTPFWLHAFLGLHTGMRPGEIAGLCWDDVDLAKASLSVTHTMNSRVDRFYRSSPKSKASLRSIDLSPEVVDVLREREQSIPQNFWMSTKVKGGEPGQRVAGPVGFRPVCAGLDGRMFSIQHWGKVFGAKARAAGLGRVRLHDLRHTHATLLLLDGVPIHVVSRRLGHSSIRVTIDEYGHLLPDSDRVVAVWFADILNRAR